MIHAPGSAPLNAGIVRDLARLSEVLLGDWPLQPPEGLTGAAQATWWSALHQMHGTDAGNYFEQRDALCRLYLEVVQMRMHGPLRDSALFQNALAMLGCVKGRARFMREAVSRGYHAATLDSALAKDNPQPETFDDPHSTAWRKRLDGAPYLGEPLQVLLNMLQAAKNDLLVHEIQELRASDGFVVQAREWGLVLDSKYTKMVFAWGLLRCPVAGRGQRLFTDWTLFGNRDPRLQALRASLEQAGTPLALHITASDARSDFLQFEVASHLPTAHAFGDWFQEVYLPDVLPAQLERVMDPAYYYPVVAFPG